MSPELEKSFSDVYDRVPGQTKLSAFFTFDRECPTLNDEVMVIGSNLGGGSLAAVWEMTTVNGEEVVKVLNPNAEFFVDTVCDILDKTFAALADKYPAQARLAQLAVRDIRTWLKNDINDEGFLERDREFTATHQGFTLPGSRYRIRIPKTYGQDSKYYKREEKITGTNLTQLTELAAAGHDMRAITQVVVANVVQQIATGRMHSDIHPGNIRITPDNDIVWLDRNYYIDLAPAEQLLIAELAVGTGDQLASLLDYFLALPDNAALSRVQLEQKLRQAGIDFSQPEGAAQFISAAKEAGVYTPLKVTLVVKNFLALNKLARNAGFGSLREVLAA
jgi:predicted unusual protein kinase regulating ubiquinone biosynthesis (AarF/ABC1/UbiB family)